MRKRRTKRLHPILREINRRKAEIARLTAAAKMIGVDLGLVTKPPTTVGPKKAAAYHAVMQEAMAPDPKPDPLEIPAVLKREVMKPKPGNLAETVNKPFREVAKRKQKRPNTKPLDKMLQRMLG